MFYILESFSVYSDTWKMTFYLIGAVAVLVGIFWTYYQQYKREEEAKKDGKINNIYNKSEDVIEEIDYMPVKKGKNAIDNKKIGNYYDVYQNEKKLNQKEFQITENKLETDSNDIPSLPIDNSEGEGESIEKTLEIKDINTLLNETKKEIDLNTTNSTDTYKESNNINNTLETTNKPNKQHRKKYYYNNKKYQNKKNI